MEQSEPLEQKKCIKSVLKANSTIAILAVVGIIISFLLFVVSVILLYIAFTRPKEPADSQPPKKNKKPKPPKPKSDTKAVVEQEKQRAVDIQNNFVNELVTEYKEQRIPPAIITPSDTEPEDEQSIIEVLDD